MTSDLRTARRMDRQLEPFIPLFPPADLNDPITARKKLAELSATASVPDVKGMQIEDRTVPGNPDVPVRIYRPHQAQGAIVWLHGGGFVMGGLDIEHPLVVRIADGSGAVVVSVGYRLAPEHRFPAALDDAYVALTWTAEHAAELGIDPQRIAVGGHAAGAGLAAAVALRARDQQGPPIRFQLLNQPELDDRQADVVGTELHRYAIHDARQGRCIVEALPGVRARLTVRRSGAGYRSVRPAARLHHLRGVRSEPR